MSRHAARRPRRSALRVALVVALLLGVALVVFGGRGSFASFTDSASITAGSAPATAFTSGALATPVLSGPAQSSDKVTLSWAPTTAGTTGRTATAYEVYRYAGASGGTGTLVCATEALTCADSSSPQATVYYVLRARIGTNWVKDSARVSFTPVIVNPPADVKCSATGFLGLGGNYIVWDAPSGSGYTYQVSWTQGGNSGTVSGITDTQWRPTTLPNGTYTVQVSAVRNGIQSALSSSSGAITRGTLLGAYYIC